MTGKKVAIATGQTVTFGRAAGRAQFALPHDTFMSGVHFAVECGPGGCRVQDRKSSNGTFLNGARIQDAMLANGDEIKGGQTIFTVKIVADAKLASLMPPQELAPSSAPQPRSPVAVLPAREQQPPDAEPVAPPELPVAKPSEEPKRTSDKLSPEPAAPSESVSEAPEGNASGFFSALPSAPASRERPPAGIPEPPQRKREDVAAAPPSEKLAPRAEPPVKNISPGIEVPPRFHAIPSPPRPGATPPNASANAPRAGENPPNAGVKPPRTPEPPPGVAPHIAQKFGENPAARGLASPRNVAFRVMGWSFPAAPVEWQVQEGFGLQQSGHEEFPNSVAASEELLAGITLQQFVESQISTLRGYLRDPKIEPTMPPRVNGADESMAMDVRHSTKDGRELVYRRIYARSGSSVGVLTVTTLAADLPTVLQSLQPLLDGAAFHSTVNN
jgi:hypothetical protein